MDAFFHGLRWFALLLKRACRRPGTLVLLLLIPLVTIGFKLTAAGESGVLTVALASEDPADALTEQVTAGFESDGLIRYVRCDTAAEAEALVRAGKADSAWLFPAELERRISRFVLTRDSGDAVVRVVQRQDDVQLQLLREKLGAAMMELCSRQFFLDYARRSFPELAALPDGELLRYYDTAWEGGALFAFENGAGEAAESVLLSPVRGILAVVTVLAGLTSALSFDRDEGAGTFDGIPAGTRPLVEWASVTAGVLPVAASSALALFLSSLSVSPGRELALLALAVWLVPVFAMLLRRIFHSAAALGTAAAVLTVAQLAVCPVFYELGALRDVQRLLPAAPLINGAVDAPSLWEGALLGVVCLALTAAWELGRGIFPRRR